MANRSYLYATNVDNSVINGVSEHDYEIPLSYKILVSQDAKTVDSIIWDYPAPIAIRGDFAKGRRKLFDFLDSLAADELFKEFGLTGYIAKTKEFLNSPDNANDYFHLENGEIYDMDNEDDEYEYEEEFDDAYEFEESDEDGIFEGEDELEVQNRIFFDNDIAEIENTIENALTELRELAQPIADKPGGLFAKRKKEKALGAILDILGIDNWSSTLHYITDE